MASVIDFDHSVRIQQAKIFYVKTFETYAEFLAALNRLLGQPENQQINPEDLSVFRHPSMDDLSIGIMNEPNENDSTVAIVAQAKTGFFYKDIGNDLLTLANIAFKEGYEPRATDSLIDPSHMFPFTLRIRNWSVYQRVLATLMACSPIRFKDVASFDEIKTQALDDRAAVMCLEYNPNNGEVMNWLEFYDLESKCVKVSEHTPFVIRRLRIKA